jgi:hypothetical protein
MSKLRLINGKGDYTADPPTGATAGDLYHMANDFIDQEGVLHLDSDCIVSESDTPGMSVQVAPGIIYVENSSWAEDSEEPRFFQVVRDEITSGVAISSNPSGSTRIDLICQEIDKVTTPNDDADNVIPITVVEGTPGAGAPATPADHYVLAEVSVASGETSITDGDITDRREQIFAGPRLTNSAIVEEADAATITFDLENGKYNKFYTTITANRTFAVDNVPIGLPFLIMVEQGTTPPNTPTWWGNILWSPDGDSPSVSSVLGAVDSFMFIKLASGDFLGFQVGFGAQ